MRSATLAVLCLGLAFAPLACRPPNAGGAGAAHDAGWFLRSRLAPWPASNSPGEVAVTDPSTGRVATYDSALVALVLVRAGDRARAARVLLGLFALQGEDGAIPFSFTLPGPRSMRYERTGAIAWAGYAAAEYLDADAGGPARGQVLRLAQRAARYVLAHQVHAPGDPREGLVRGGTGTIRYEAVGDGVREVLEPGDISWVSVEHNVDAFFFLRALARVAEAPEYTVGAQRIADALAGRAWSDRRGQLVEGFDPDRTDDTPALDCASWGSLFLGASGHRDRAEKALATAESRYASRDPVTSVPGHRPYADGPVLSDEDLARQFSRALPAADWANLEVVWPEGSAGVALAAWRLGHVDRARAIVDALEPLRADDGSLPTATMEVPYLFDRAPSIAGTAWVELVRFELDRPTDQPTLWVP